MWSLWKAPVKESQVPPSVLGQGHAICPGELYSIWKTTPDCAMRTLKEEAPDHGAPDSHVARAAPGELIC